MHVGCAGQMSLPLGSNRFGIEKTFSFEPAFIQKGFGPFP